MKKNVFYALIRWLALALFVAVLVVLAMQNKTSNADFETVTKEVTQALDMSAMQEGNAATLKRLYSLNPEDYEAVALYWPVSNMDAEELLIIKLKDVSQQAEIISAVESRLETQKKSFDGYGIEQYALLTDKSVLDIRGNYVLFVVNADCFEAERVFRAAL